MFIGIALACMVGVLCTPAYIKWHLGRFEQGGVYTLLNLLAPPKNYYHPVATKTLLSGRKESILLKHQFAGKYIIKIKGRKGLSYSGSLSCEGNKLEFSNNNSSVYIEGFSEHWIYLYSVPSQVPFEANCNVTIKIDELKRLEFTIVKFTHK